MRTLYLVVLVLTVFVTVLAAGKSYYDILDVPRDAQKAQIKRHFKKLSRVYHPDKNAGDEKASEKFMEIANAYEVLMDDEKRQIYDRFGEEGLKNHQGGGGGGGHGHGFGHDPFDIFSQFFGGGGGHHHGHGHGERRGEDLVIPLQVSLEDLFNGAEIELDVSKQVLCNQCRGSGARSSDDVKSCTTCNGQGIIVQRIQMGPGMFQQIQQECHVCHGKGKVIKHACPTCAGKKVLRGNENYTVHVEKGMQDQHKIVLEEEADELPDTTPGNIVFVLKTVPHLVFERRGHNLYTKQHITLIEALGGFEKTMKHLDNSTIHLKREGVTQYGFVQTIKGQGMPKGDSSSKQGDLFVEYNVVFPDRIDPETIEHLKRYNHPEDQPKLVHQEL